MKIVRYRPGYEEIKADTMNVCGESQNKLYVIMCRRRLCIQMKVEITKDDKFWINSNYTF